jgi:hypothetical protein
MLRQGFRIHAFLEEINAFHLHPFPLSADILSRGSSMSVSAVQGYQAVAEITAVSQAQAAQKQSKQSNPLPEDRVTISAAAQAKQTANSIGADKDHDGK